MAGGAIVHGHQLNQIKVIFKSDHRVQNRKKQTFRNSSNWRKSLPSTIRKLNLQKHRIRGFDRPDQPSPSKPFN